MKINTEILESSRLKNKTPFLIHQRVDTGTNLQKKVTFQNGFGGDFLLKTLTVRYSNDSHELPVAPSFDVTTDYTFYVDLNSSDNGDGSNTLPFTAVQWLYHRANITGTGKSYKYFMKGSFDAFLDGGASLYMGVDGNDIYYLPWIKGRPFTLRFDAGIQSTYTNSGRVLIYGARLFAQDALGERVSFGTSYRNFAFLNCHLYGHFLGNYFADSETTYFTNKGNLLDFEVIEIGSNIYDSVIIASTRLERDGQIADYTIRNCALSTANDTVFGGVNWINCQKNWVAGVMPSLVSSKNSYRVSTLYATINPVVFSGDGIYRFIESDMYGETRFGIGAGWFDAVQTHDGDEITISLLKKSSSFKYFEFLPSEHISTFGECTVAICEAPCDNDAFGIAFKSGKRLSHKSFNWLIESNCIIEIDIVKKKIFPQYIDFLLSGYFVPDETIQAVQLSKEITS